MQELLKQAMMSAVHENPKLLQKFPGLQEDKDIVEASLQHQRALYYLNEIHKNDRQLIKKYAEIQSGRAGWKNIELYLGEKLAIDDDFAKDLIEKYGMKEINGWSHAIGKAHANKDFIYYLLDSNLANHIDYDGLSDELKKDSHIYLSMIKQYQKSNPWEMEATLKTAHTKLRSNPNFAYECLMATDRKERIVDCFIGEAKKIMFGNQKHTWKTDLDEAIKKLSSYSLKATLSKDLDDKPTAKRMKI
ncbi:hypothetical protein [Burkholderia cenocepacia]|uniref:hypothetical protein n=1 Tax=Burkholderia cenocepacia TaxID=95486 RepID=UPI0011783114|nr:hypothetical protein [Burkholderia cenocepacia]